MVQSFTSRLRYNKSNNEIPIVLNDPIHTTKQGFPTVILEEDDYYVKLAADCKYTLVGKSKNTIPKMKLVRKSFILQTQVTWSVTLQC